MEKLDQIRFREKEIHSNQSTKKGDKLPDVIGYETEDLMLSDFMVHLSNTFKDSNPIFCRHIYHIENEGNTGGKYGAISGAISKGKGKKKGILDVCCDYLGVLGYLEFKLIKGKFSDEQLDIISDLVYWNVPVFIIREFDFFWFVVCEVLIKGIKLKGFVYISIEQVKSALLEFNIRNYLVHKVI